MEVLELKGMVSYARYTVELKGGRTDLDRMVAMEVWFGRLRDE
jgi:hypothetical protein